MISYRRVIPPLVLIGGIAIASVFAPRMLERLRSRQKERQQALPDAANAADEEAGRTMSSGVGVP